MFENHQFQLQLHDGKEVADVEVFRKVHSRQRAKTRDRKELGLFRKVKPRLLWPGQVAEDGDVNEGRMKSCWFWKIKVTDLDFS